MSDKTEDTTLEMKLLERELKPDRLSHKDIPSLPENDLIVLFGHYTAEEIARIFHSTTPTISLLQANIRADAESKSKKKYSRLSWDNKDILNYGPTPRAEVLRIFDKVYANRLAKRGRVKNKVKFPHNFFDNDDQMGILTGWRRAKIVFDQYVKKEFGGYDDSLLGLFNTKYFNYDSIMNLKDSIIDNFPEHLMNPHYYSTSQIFKELFRNSVDPEVRARYKDLEIYHFPRFKHWITYKGKPDLELGEKYFREVVLAHAKNGMSVDEIVAGSYRSLCDTDLEIKYGANASQVYRNLKNSSKENERRVIKAIRENLNSLAKDKVRFKHFVDEALLVEHLKSDLKDSEMEYVEAPAPKQLSDEILLKAISYMTSSNSQYVLYHNQARWRFKGQDMKTLKQEYLAQDHNFNPELLITYFEKSMEMTKRENLTGMLTNKAALENGLAARKNFVVLDHVFRNRLNLDYDDSIFDKFRTKLLENNFFNRNYRFAVVNKYFSDSQFAGFVRKFLEEHPDPVVRKFYEGVGNQHFISHIAPASNWSGKWINGDDTPGLRAIKEMFSSYLRQGKSLKDIIEISHFFERKNLMRFNRDPSMINMGFFWGASQAKYRFCKSQHFVDWVNEHDAEYGLEDQIRKDFRFKSAKDMKWRLKTTDIPSFRQIKMSRDDVKRRQITKKVADELKKHQQYGELIEASDSTYLQQLVDIACTVVPETWQLDETINAKEVSKMLLDPLYRDHLTHAERAQRAFHFYKKSTKHHHKVPLLCEWYHKQALVDFFSSFPKHFQDRLDQRVRCLSPHTVSERNDAIENYFLHNRDLERLFGEKYLKNVRLSILGLKAGDLDNFRTIQDQTRKQVLKCRLGMKKWNKLFNNYILTDDFFLSMKKVQDIDFKRRDMKLIRQFAAEHGYHSLATEETLILSDDSQNRGSYRVDIRLPNFDNNAKIKIVSIFTKMMDSSSQVKATEASYNALASIGCNVPAHLSYLANNNILVTEFIDEGKSLLKYIRDKDLNYMCAAKKVVEEMVKVHYLLPEKEENNVVHLESKIMEKVGKGLRNMKWDGFLTRMNKNLMPVYASLDDCICAFSRDAKPDNFCISDAGEVIHWDTDGRPYAPIVLDLVNLLVYENFVDDAQENWRIIDEFVKFYVQDYNRRHMEATGDNTNLLNYKKFHLQFLNAVVLRALDFYGGLCSRPIKEPARKEWVEDALQAIDRIENEHGSYYHNVTSEGYHYGQQYKSLKSQLKGLKDMFEIKHKVVKKHRLLFDKRIRRTKDVFYYNYEYLREVFSERAEVQEDIVNMLLNNSNRDKEKFIVRMLYETGCKPSELTQLKPADVDFENNKVSLPGLSETILPREVQISGALTADLSEYLGSRGIRKHNSKKPLIATQWQGEELPLDIGAVNKACDRVSNDYIVQHWHQRCYGKNGNITAKKLREFRMVRLLKEGIAHEEIADFLGVKGRSSLNAQYKTLFKVYSKNRDYSLP